MRSKINLEQRLISYSQPCPGITITDFLQAGKGQPRFYWQDQGRSFAGFGTAHEIVAWSNRFETVAAQAKKLFQRMVVTHEATPPRLFGGFAFSPDFVPDNTWSVFAPAHFVLPHYQFAEVDGEAWLTLNVLITSDENPDESLNEIREAAEARYEFLLEMQRQPISREKMIPAQVNYPMPFEVWEWQIEHARKQMQHSELQKVVLARVCELRFRDQVDVDGALAYLNENYADCYRFLFEPRPSHAFYGATPELLVEVNGDQVRTMGLAGSIQRGKNAREDKQLGKQLSDDPKERHEHALVVNAIREKLQGITDILSIPEEPEVLRLRNIQHLHTPISGTLKDPAGVLPVLEALHPTPALGGTPREMALAFIHEAEPVPRGWYAAPVGWIDANLDGAFGVAIRSAVSQDQRVWLYAGAGIVAQSQPKKEWDETGLKFKPMLNAHGVEGGV